MKLIYHDINIHNQISQFDKEIVEIVKGQELLIVCPYIGLGYINRILNLSSNWKIITDIEEWIYSHQNNNQRDLIREFIKCNSERIRHISLIHAKVIITEKKAFLGSSNLTESGICERIEMSVSFDDQDKINELKDWFGSLWSIGIIPQEQQIESFIKNNSTVHPRKVSVIKNQISLKIKKATLVNLNNLISVTKDHEMHFAKSILKLSKDISWINGYFDLINDLFTEFKISNDSQKIAMSVNKDFKIPISIGQRYIIRPRKTGIVGLIMPLEFEDIVNDYKNANIEEGYFYDKRKNQEAFWVNFDISNHFEFDSTIINLWKSAVEKELNRTTISGFRKYHNPAYFKAVIEKDYRERLFKPSL
jgi:hypothetical protein